MQKETINSYINKISNIDELIDLFYEFLNSYEAIEALPVCIKIFNRINKIEKEINEEESLLVLQLRNLYVFSMGKINQVIFDYKYEKHNDPKETDKLFYLGFNIIAEKENQDPEVKEYFAKNMVIDMLLNIFPKHRFDIEKDIHRKYQSKEKLINSGINNAFINVIKDYDPNLANYISCHVDIFKSVKSLMNNIVDNYDNYEYENEKRTYKYIIRETRNYSENNNINSEEYLLRLAAEYNVLDKIIKNSDEYTQNDYMIIKDFIISCNRNDIDFHYMNIKKIFEKYLKSKYIDERDWYLDETDEELLKKKKESFLLNYNDYSEEEISERASEILSLIKTTEEFDDTVSYLKHHKIKNNILKIANKKEGN